jgi:DNA-binding transcriptional LysR family regulator
MENSKNLNIALKSQSVDMVITYGDLLDPSFQKVYSSHISMGLQKAKGKLSTDYSKEFFFVSHDKDCPYRNRTLSFLEESNLSKKLLQQLDSYSLIKEFVIQGKGLAFLPVDCNQLALMEEVPLVNLPIHFVTRRESEKMIPIELFD